MPYREDRPSPGTGSDPYRSGHNARTVLSDFFRSAIGGTGGGLLDRYVFNNAGRNAVDRLFGAEQGREQSDYASYMRQMMRNDPGAGRGPSLSERFRDMFGRWRNDSGAPLPQWMSPNYPGASALNDGPPSPGYIAPDFSGLMPTDPSSGPNDLYGQGQGMMRPPAPPVRPTRGVGTRGGEVVARGQAAQDFVEGFRTSMNQQNLQNQARNAMENMFRGSVY